VDSERATGQRRGKETKGAFERGPAKGMRGRVAAVCLKEWKGAEGRVGGGGAAPCRSDSWRRARANARGGRWLLVVVVGSWSLGGAEGGEAPTGGGGFSEGRKGRHRLKDGTFDADSRAARA
jgi:hypothetical protein